MKGIPRLLPEVVEVNPRRFTNDIGDDSLVSFVPMKSVEEETGHLDAKQTRRWVEVKKGYTPFQDGDVLFAKITPCMENGKYALASNLHDGRAAGSTEFHVFRPKSELDSKYLLFFLFSPDVRREAKRNMRGAAGQLRVPPIFFETLQIPLPPLEEQKRVVAEIEKQFTRLDAGLASLKQVQLALKRYRASVLKAACEGRLVPTEAELALKENRSYETGEQLLQRLLKERREKWKLTDVLPPFSRHLPP
jgi:type I restriction enzyme S subunit